MGTLVAAGVGEAVAWYSGVSVDPAVAVALGVAPGPLGDTAGDGLSVATLHDDREKATNIAADPDNRRRRRPPRELARRSVSSPSVAPIEHSWDAIMTCAVTTLRVTQPGAPFGYDCRHE